MSDFSLYGKGFGVVGKGKIFSTCGIILSSDFPSSDLPSSHDPIYGDISSDGPSSDVPSSDLPSSQDPIYDYVSSDGPSSDVPSSGIPSSDAVSSDDWYDNITSPLVVEFEGITNCGNVPHSEDMRPPADSVNGIHILTKYTDYWKKDLFVEGFMDAIQIMAKISETTGYISASAGSIAGAAFYYPVNIAGDVRRGGVYNNSASCSALFPNAEWMGHNGKVYIY